jgi:Kef-type K+ transport system membrane component KefB
MLDSVFIISLPLADPVLKFLLILCIILFVPILTEKIKIPQLLGLIIAGAIIGPYGINLIVRDSSIILSGTAGLLYIMFLAGLEIDMNDFKKNVWKSTILGLYGFFIPMILGTIVVLYVLGFSMMTSILLASMFASHTLITYPIVSKLGITRNIAVNISVGSTLITNVLALLVLAVIVGMTSGDISQSFWIRLVISFLIFFLIIMFVFPVIARWFFKQFSDNVSQYIFVLTMVFLGAVLSQVAGIEAIIGAFLAGLALNRLIPRTSPLMNRIDFVGNAIFIPFFLIGVGMLIDYRAFFSSYETIKVAVVISVVATVSKLIAAWLTQKTFKFSVDERRLIFGMTNAQAAATLAAVLVGYNIIIGTDSEGSPVRLLNDAILNGTIIMILVTCTVASFATERGAKNVALKSKTSEDKIVNLEKILILVNNPRTIEELLNLSMIIKNKGNLRNLFALNVVNPESSDTDSERNAKKILEQAEILASAGDVELTGLLRYDSDILSGVSNVIKEQNITDLLLGLHEKKGITDTFLGLLTEGILNRSNITTFVYKPVQPISTIKRHIVVVPEHAEYESGFSFWLAKIWNIGFNTGAKVVFYSSEPTLDIIRKINEQHPIEAEFRLFDDWNDFLILSKDVSIDDNLIIVMSRKHAPSYHHSMGMVSAYLRKYFDGNNFILVYPMQETRTNRDKIDLTNPSLIKTIEGIDVMGKTIAGIFKKKYPVGRSSEIG